MIWTRRGFIRSLSRTALVLPFEDVLKLAMPAGAQQQVPQIGARPSYDAKPRPAPKTLPSPVTGMPLGFSFVDVAKQSGLHAKTIYGDEHKNRFLLETTGCGVAFYDFDHDDWLDIFLVNGTRLEGFPKGQEPISRLFKNNRDGTFTDITAKTGMTRSGWGQGCCVGDYDNDGLDDLFVSYYGQPILYKNHGDGTFTDVTAKAGLTQSKTRWNSGCAFLDYDKDGHLDLFVANYIDFDIKTAPLPEAAGCEYKGIQVACGPPGLDGGKNILYHNNGDGTFTDVSQKAGMWDTIGTYGLSVTVADFDNDGWPDIYVANDSTAATYYQNQKDGTFKDVAIEAGIAYSPDGKPQAGMGVAVGDFNRDGLLDIVKTNFAGDTDSLYENLGDGSFEDHTYLSGLGINTRYLGWGVSFVDVDNDGWLDILISNGHVYPEVDGSHLDAPYAEHKYLYRNLRNGQFEEVTSKAGSGMTDAVPARGCAIGDYDNDGDMDVVVNCVNAVPQLLRCDAVLMNGIQRNWIKIKLVGTKSNRTGIGARITVTATTAPQAMSGVCKQPMKQIDEVRSGGSYYSQNDLRMHFGLDQAVKVDEVTIAWPSGTRDSLKDLAANHLYVVQEGGKILRAVAMGGVVEKAAK
ncbi:CRTAC1 family protein [Granulicella sp. 5B5]|uniref:CRTAC1 family protein n=1 Tax=Granulicella sp. 5B5 TaxID=1617967 RepID=UPI0015F6594C|nr:CRTAC1 family protein [Granulicella sp. 5B5]QMV18621.1 CRTAC1 family protein [Granulicella sp. 5B5]